MWRHVPAVLAFALLAFQAAIPWIPPHFVTQDGPSHLYTGVVLRDMLLDRNETYSSVYTLQDNIVPNWASAVLLGAAATLAGVAHAEALLASLSIVAGFFAFSYACAALYPDAPPWSPLANFLLQNCFLAIGFYNFYLGMVLCPLMIGYYVRAPLTIRRAALLSTGLLALFFTHIIAAALAAITIGVIELWTARFSWRRVAILAAALVPLLVMTVLFAKTSTLGVNFRPETSRALKEFPKMLFITGPGRSGREDLLWPVMFLYMVIAAFALTRQEWHTPRGGLLIAAVLIGILYLIAPDEGFGGMDVKKRLAWGVFILGGLLACSVERLRTLRAGVSMYVAFFLAANLMTSLRMHAATSRVVDVYLSATDRIPNGATFVRLYYPTPTIGYRFAYQGVPLAPLFHEDAMVAATRQMIDLSDYQAASGIFPVTYAPLIDTRHRRALWNLENAASPNAAVLNWLRATLPVAIDYVIVVGELNSADAARSDMAKTIADLESGMRLVSTAGPDSLVRVYQRVGAP